MELKVLTYKRIIRKFLEKVSSLIVILFLLFAVVFTNYLKKHDLKIMYIASESMEPTIKAHQFVIGQKIDPSELQIGDIATYRNDMITITHRIIDETENSFEFKGDNNLTSDGYINKGRVLYKIIKY